MKAFVTCVKPKINAMCDEAADKHSVIIDLIENAQDAYCDGTKAKQSVVDGK